MTCLPTPDHIARAVNFHGHHCPGLSFGLRAAVWAVQEFGRSGDEEICVITETDMCAVDAIQALVGCTFGKGNLLYRPLGKVAFSFYRRVDGKAVRLIQNPQFWKVERQRAEALGKEAARETFIRAILEAPFEAVFSQTAVREPMPDLARLVQTVICARCGEGVMETMTRKIADEKVCCLACMDS